MPDAMLPEIVQHLIDPGAYPHPVGKVQLIQTHISYVFLAGDFVYKVKKPVEFGFLNFSTLSRRRYYCRQEVKLNSRLCSDTYLGVIPVRRGADGRHRFGGRGQTVEYAVHMRRLPEHRMMHRLLDHDEVTPRMMQRLARKLAAFHAAAETSPAIACYGDWAIRYNQRENEQQWAPYIGRVLTPEQDRILRAYAEAFYARRAGVLRRRVEQLRICRVHADLRADAVCFTNGICVYDCVEFSRRISLLDVARDVGFLEMDLRDREREDLGNTFVRAYISASKDRDLPAVIDFYAMYSACVRGKVKAFLLDLPEIPQKEKRRAKLTASRYFGLAVEYAKALPPALLVITCGLPGTGKSTLARAVAAQTGFDVLSSDIVRKQMAGLEPSEHRYETYRAGIYSTEATERTYAELLARARPHLEDGRSVIIDASFIRRQQRRAASGLASETGAQFACLYLPADDREARRRLERRFKAGTDVSDARWEIYRAQKRRLQRPHELPADRLIEVDSARPLKAQSSRVLRRLRAISPLSLPPRRPRRER